MSERTHVKINNFLNVLHQNHFIAVAAVKGLNYFDNIKVSSVLSILKLLFKPCIFLERAKLSSGTRLTSLLKVKLSFKGDICHN